MGRIRIRSADDTDFIPTREAIRPENWHLFSEDELDSTVRFFEKGTSESLQLFEVHYLPNCVVDVHAHDEDEIIYVLAGELWVGNRRLLPGSTVFVSGNTLYGFRAGPEGLKMLNFRPRADGTFYTPEQYKRKKAGIEEENIL